MTPPLPGHVCIAPHTDELYTQLAAMLMQAAFAAVKARGAFHLALSGGATPEPFYVHLMIDVRCREFPWESTHLWQVDERIVPMQDPRRNWKMIHETLVSQTPMRSRPTHPMPVHDHSAAPGNTPARSYEIEMRAQIPSETLAGHELPRFDFVLLGMGSDAHTASLFPNSPATREQKLLVALNDGANVTPPPRLTLTYPALNAAREVVVLVTGSAKHRTLQHVAEHNASAGPDPTNLPITGIEPFDGELTWFLDAPAATGK